MTQRTKRGVVVDGDHEGRQGAPEPGRGDAGPDRRRFLGVGLTLVGLLVILAGLIVILWNR